MKKAKNKDHLRLVREERKPSFLKKGFRFLGRMILVLLLLLILKEGHVYFQVRHIDVVGTAGFDRNELIKAGGILEGRSIFFINEQQVAEQIRAVHHSAKEVTVTRELPDRVVIEIEVREIAAYASSANGYRLIDAEGICFALVADEPVGYPPVYGLEDSQVVPGEPIQCRASRDALISFFQTWPQAEGLPELVSLDLSNAYNLVATLEGGMEIWLGGPDEMWEKLSLVRKALPQLEIDEMIRLDVRTVKRLVVSGIDSIDI